MKMVNGDNFCQDAKYKLYRNVFEILHPTISKRNISNYKVVLDEKLLPLQVFYPKRVSDMKKVIIAIPGDGRVSGCYGKYASIYKNMAIEIDSLIIAVDYFGRDIKYPTSINKISKVVSYLYDEFIKNGILEENIIFMSDSIGCGILGELLLKLKKKKNIINKSIWLYPVCKNDYTEYVWDKKYLSMNMNLDKRVNNYLDKYFTNGKSKGRELLSLTKDDLFGKNIVISGKLDVLKNEGQEFSKNIEAEFLSIDFLTHGFLEKVKCDEIKEVFSKIDDFVKL